jgi:uncharacterized protein YpbB
LHTVSRQRIEAKQRERSTGSTVETTLAMLREGRSVAQTAAERQLSIDTIYAHCSELIVAGRLDVTDVVAEARITRVLKAIETLGNVDRLAPVKTLLPADYGFGEIRCVAAFWRASR